MEDIIRIQSNDLAPTRGRVLISEPFLGDYYFGRSVVLLIEHDDGEGTFGVIMNKPISTPVNKIIVDFPHFESNIFPGGPGQQDQLYFLHTLGDLVTDAAEVFKGIYWGGDIEVIKAMIQQGAVKPHQIRFFLGYSGWESKQLKGELDRNAWLVSHTTSRALMHTKPMHMWSHFIRRMGTKYDLWLRFPESPELN